MQIPVFQEPKKKKDNKLKINFLIESKQNQQIEIENHINNDNNKTERYEATIVN